MRLISDLLDYVILDEVYSVARRTQDVDAKKASL